MTNEEILKTAVAQAVKNDFMASGITGCTSEDAVSLILTANTAKDVIFSRAFAKAFWGEEDHPRSGRRSETGVVTLKRWEYHLQQMVLAEDPIAYLSRFL